jgi:hypothetical protein
MMKQFCLCLALVGAAILAGCSNAPPSEDITAAPPPAKKMLEDVAQSGQLGSSALSIRDSLEQMKATDEAKANELLAEMDKLEKMGNPNDVKAQAKKMADRL